MSHTSRNRRPYFESLEVRQMFAAHIVGDPASYATIQAAVNAAMPGAIVNVDAGVYSEQVTINKQLTVRGAQAGIDPRGNARLYASTSTESILNGYDTGTGRSPSFLIKANDVTIDGFTIQGNTSTDHMRQAGIVIGPLQHGTHVLFNIVQNNVSGLFLSNDSATDAGVIQYNVFRNNNNPGTNGGRGIYSDGEVSGGNLTNVVIDSNFFYNNRGGTSTTTYEGAIAFQSRTDGSQSNLTISNNVFDRNGKAILAYNTDGIVIKGNIATGTYDQWSGTFRFEGDVHDAVIQKNTVYANTGPAIRIDNKGFNNGVNSSGFVVTSNNFFGNSTMYSNKESLVVGADQYDGTLDARNNWWGNSSGPSFIQQGTGDRITANGINILYSPWATASVGGVDLPYLGAPFSAGAVIQAEDFDHGGEGIAYHDADKANSGTKYRTTGVDIESTTDGGTGFDVGWFVKGEWLRYNVKLDQSGTYNIDFRVANQAAGGVFHLEVDGVNVTGAMAVPNTANWQIFKTITKTGVSLTAGNHVLRIVGDANGTSGRVGNFNWIKLTSTAAVPAAPSKLLAVPTTTSQINLTWKDNATNETGFKIERSLDGVTYALLKTVGANVASYADLGLTNGQTYWYRVRATNAVGDSSNSNITYAAPVPVNTGPVYIGDLPWVSATSDWGTVQHDASVKGTPITLRGVVYQKGLGTHAVSSVVYNLAGGYSNFVTDVGLDDEVAGLGNVIFRVIGDGKVLFDSGVVTGTSPVIHVNVDVTGVQQLTLLATNGVDGTDYDHADWAGAQLFKTAPALTAPAVPANFTAVATSETLVSLSWFNTDNTQTGVKIERSIDGINFTTIATVDGNASNFNDTTVAPTTRYWYRIRSTNSAGDSTPSTILTVTTPAHVTQTPYLSDLDWVSATAGWGTTQKDATIKGNTITLRGVTYARGIGTHADTTIVYNLGGQFASFMSDIGIDDETGGNGAVIFQVLGDGAVLYDSGVLAGTSPVASINVNVTGVQQLTLQVTGVNGVIDYGHADWAGAKLIGI